MKPRYQFYATLLDAYQNFISSDEIYNEYWGFSDEPPHTEDEFRELQRQSLLDRINRVPFDNEKADRGTAFNEVVDCLVLNQKSDKMDISSDKDAGVIYAEFNNRIFYFPISICLEFANYYKGAIPQVLTEGLLWTRYGLVRLYGYIDELMPTSIHDIKTTGKYEVGKFKKNWQHIVYPFCLNQQGNLITDFEYNILVITVRKGGDICETFTEHYNYVQGRDTARLTQHVEGLIEFIERNRDIITDKKIFNQTE